MTVVSAFEDRVLFSLDVAPETNALLQSAVAAHNDHAKAEAILLQAISQDPQCLQTYFALYKLYFYAARLAEAEAIARQGLNMAAELGKFPADPEALCQNQLSPVLYSSEAGLFYLYTLKAVAFIKLRQDQGAEARQVLSCIDQLDPEDRSGASVIASLAAAFDEDDDD